MQIKVEQVSYCYPGCTSPTLKNISLTIEQGEWICLLGRTGSGKSTLIQHVNGLLLPSSGHVLLDGIDPSRTKKGWASARKQIGLVFQYPEHQLFADRVAKDVAFALEAQNIGHPGEYEQRVNRSLAAVGLDPDVYRERNPFQLSGGEKRRVAIACTLVYEPSVLILDEPTAGLDPRQRSELLQLLSRWHKEQNTTIICVTHDIGEWAAYAERALVLNEGRISYDGALTQLLASPAPLFQAGLSLPPLAQVVHLLNGKGWGLHPKRFDMEEIQREILRKWNGFVTEETR